MSADRPEAIAGHCLCNAVQIELLDLNTGLMVPYTDLTNGAGEVVVQPTTTTTYMLIAENAGGDAVSAMLTITVIP